MKMTIPRQCHVCVRFRDVSLVKQDRNRLTSHSLTWGSPTNEAGTSPKGLQRLAVAGCSTRQARFTARRIFQTHSPEGSTRQVIHR